MTATIAFPPGPRRGLESLRIMHGFQHDGLQTALKLERAYGDVAHFRVGPRHFYVFNHPDMIREIVVTKARSFTKGQLLRRSRTLLGDGLLTSEGEHHLRQRRLVQPAFHRQRIAGYGAVMSGYAERSAGRWEHGATLDISAEMMRLTLAIVGKTLFDADVEEEASEVGAALDDLMGQFDLLASPFYPILNRVLINKRREFERAKARLDATIARLIAEHRASDDRGDLLSMLLLSRDEQGDGGGMSDQQVRDESLTLFLAGHETTAQALAWTWHLLALNPEAEAQLHAEVDALDHTPGVADMERLSYTRMVFSEAMRLYPPAWAISREAAEDVEIGGFSVPRQSLCVMSQYLVHRQARFYPDPERFDPLRWTPEAQAARPKFAYFPFGGGNRLCIGESFAWMEGILVLATIARRWKMRHAPEANVVPRPLITLRLRHGLPMVLEKR